MSDIDDPTWPEILRAAQKRGLLRVHTSAPGIVVDYDDDTQTATIQVAVNEEAAIDDDGSATFETIQPLAGVRIAWPAGGGFGITMPLVAGDTVELVFNESDPSAFRATGEISDPKLLGRHGLYPFAIPCKIPDGKTLPASAGKLIVSSNHGTGPSMTIDGSAVHIGGTASQFVALGPAVDAGFNNLKSYLAGLTLPVVGTAAGGLAVTGTAGPPTPSWPGASPTSATKAKAE